MARTPFWEDTLVNFDIASGAQGITNLLVNLNRDERRGLTMIRTLFRIDLLPSIPDAAFGEQALCLGMGVSSEEAFSASALPDPNVAGDRPARGWLIRDVYVVKDHTAEDGSSPIRRVEFDVKSKRKVDSGQLFVNWTNDPIRGTAFNVRVHGLIRCLYLMP